MLDGVFMWRTVGAGQPGVCAVAYGYRCVGRWRSVLDLTLASDHLSVCTLAHRQLAHGSRKWRQPHPLAMPPIPPSRLPYDRRSFGRSARPGTGYDDAALVDKERL